MSRRRKVAAFVCPPPLLAIVRSATLPISAGQLAAATVDHGRPHAALALCRPHVAPRSRAMCPEPAPLLELAMRPVQYWLNCESYGGTITESMAVTVAVGHDYLCALRVVFSESERSPRLYLERRTTVADLRARHYQPITPEHALALHEALPTFLAALDA